MAVAGVLGASGFIISGTQSATSQYVQTGDWSKTDWLSVGKEALIGGAEGFVTGYIGAGVGSVLTNALGKTALAGSLLNSTSTVTRVASHAVIGSISQIGTGVTIRFAGSMLTNGFDIEKSTKEAFNLQGILFDGVIGGVFGGVQGLKKPQIFTSSQVQQVKGTGEAVEGSIEYRTLSNNAASGIKSIDSVTQSGVDGGNKSGSNSITVSQDRIQHSVLGEFNSNGRLINGGHGQANIDFLNQNNIEYNIVKVYDNGVRVGNIPSHKNKFKRTGTGQAWFPESWTEIDIKNAGEYVASITENVNASDGTWVFGEYNGVRVGIIKNNGKIGTIIPDNSRQL